MAQRRRTFFEKLTGAVPLDDTEYRDSYEYEEEERESRPTNQSYGRRQENKWELNRDRFQQRNEYAGQAVHIEHDEHEHTDEWLNQVDTNEGELSLDMYQTADEIVLQAMVAGVRPDDVDITITREMVTIKGHRDAPRGVEDYDYFHRELYWGAFSRTVMLPQEVEVEECEAIESHGLLILHLPKLNKAKESKLMVKSRV